MQFICNSNKYWLGGSKMDSICLDVPLAGLPQMIEVEGQALARKAEFHVTLLSASRIAGDNFTEFLEKVLVDFCQFVKEHPIEFIKFTGEFRFATQDDRATVVAMCEVSNLRELIEQIEQKYDVTIEYPPTHVTLYSLDPKTGIFLLNQSDLQTLTKPISAPVDFGSKLL